MCNFIGCSNPNHTPAKIYGVKHAFATLCLKHYIQVKRSGRIGKHYKRDPHLAYRTTKCAWCSTTLADIAHRINLARAIKGEPPLKGRSLVIESIKIFEVDHIDGNHYNNDPTNLQTMCPSCHDIKTHIFNEHKPHHAR